MDMLKSMAEYLIYQRLGQARRDTISFRELSHAWPGRFIQRHQYLEIHLVKSIEVPRNEACSHENFNSWFQSFRAICNKYKPEPYNIYNIDETGFRLGANERQYVIIDKRQTPTGNTSEAARGEFLTVIECASTDGTTIPPFVIFKGQNIQGTWFSDAAPNSWMVATSPKGWTSNSLGLNWLKRHFDPNTKAKARRRHRLLILDGHGSHLTPEFVHYCKDNRIILLCLPPHTSHMLQPLDVSCFSPLKHWFKRECKHRL
jgi:hypothetical protein